MRTITKNAIASFKAGLDFSQSNTVVKFNEDTLVTEMFLHGNLIAQLRRDGQLYLWSYKDEDFGFSNTTKERLNGILSLFNLGKYVVRKGKIRRVKGNKEDDIMDKLGYEELDIHFDF